MVLPETKTTLAYRCPHCGAGIMSAVSLFALKADMVKLKCTCGKSELTAVDTKDGKVRIKVPCIACPEPHTFTVSASLFFGKELFTLSCPYSDLFLAAMGESNLVKAELARTELELLNLMEEVGISPQSLISDEKTDSMTDPQIRDIVMFVINDMDAEGKIYCKCQKDDDERQYDAEILDDCIRVTCQKCGALREIPTDSTVSAHAFLNADALYLE